METEIISEIHTIIEIQNSMEISEEMTKFGLDREIRVFGLKNKESEELISVAVFLNRSADKSQIQLLHLYTEPAYRRQKFMEKLLNRVCAMLKAEGFLSIYCKVVGYEADKLYIFGELAEKTGFEPLIIGGFLLDYYITKMDISVISNIRKLPSGCNMKAIKELSISDKLELKDDEFIRNNDINLKQSSESKSQLLFKKDIENDKDEPIVYLEVVSDINTVPVFRIYEKESAKDYTDILGPCILYTLQKCIRENKAISEFRIVAIGSNMNEHIQNMIGMATKQQRLQEYILKL